MVETLDISSSANELLGWEKETKTRVLSQCGGLRKTNPRRHTDQGRLLKLVCTVRSQTPTLHVYDHIRGVLDRKFVRH